MPHPPEVHRRLEKQQWKNDPGGSLKKYSKDLLRSEEGSLPRRKEEIQKQQEANVLYCHKEPFFSPKAASRMMKLLRQEYMQKLYRFLFKPLYL